MVEEDAVSEGPLEPSSSSSESSSESSSSESSSESSMSSECTTGQSSSSSSSTSSSSPEDPLPELSISIEYLDALSGRISSDPDPWGALEDASSFLKQLFQKNPKEDLTEVERYALCRWIPTLFNTLSFRPLEPKAAIFANSLFQQIIALNVANFHRDLSELMHVLLWLMTYKDNVFYKKYNNLPELKEMEKSPLFPWNVRVFRKNGLKAILNRLYSTTPKVTVAIANYLITPVLRARPVINPQQLSKFTITATDAIFAFLLSLSDEELKGENKEGIRQLLSTLEMLHSREEEVSEKFETFRLQFALKCFTSPNLTKRLYGLSEFKAFIKQVTTKADFLRAAENDPNVQNPYPSLWMTCDFLVEWLNDHEVIGIMFGPSSHPEVVKRGSEIPKFLATCENSSLGKEGLQLIWEASINTHESVRHLIHIQLIELASFLKLEELDVLFHNIKELGCANFDSTLLSLIHNLTIPAIQFQSGQEGERSWFGLDLFWLILQDESNAPLVLLESALKSLKEFLNWGLCHTQRPIYFLKCLEGLREHRSVPALLQLVCRILLTYYVQTESSDKPSVVINWLNNDQNRILDLFFTDLQHYKTAVLAKAGEAKDPSEREHLHDDSKFAGRFSHHLQIRHRLDFLEHVLRNAPIQLSIPQLQTFWDCLIVNPLTPQEQDMGFQWLKRIRPHLEVTCGISNEGVRFLFECLSSFPLRSLPMSGYYLLEAHFVLLNLLEKNMSWMASHPSAPDLKYLIESQSLLGSELLFSVVTQCAKEEVGEKASMMLISLQREVSPEIGGASHYRKALIQQCMNSLSQSSSELLARKREIPTESAPTEEMKALELVMHRSLLLIQKLISQFPSVKKDDSPLTLKTRINDQVVEISDLTGSTTVRKLRARIAAIHAETATKDGSIIRIFAGGQELKDDSARLSQSRLSDGQVVLTMVRPVPRRAQPQQEGGDDMEVSDQDEDLDPKEDPSAILSEEDYFSQLFASLVVGGDVANQIWDLLVTLPTNKRLYNAILEQSGGWDQLLNSNSYYELLYSLRIVKSLLEDPSWAESFVKSGGLLRIFHLLMTPARAQLRERECLLFLLEIATHFLFEPQHNSQETKEPGKDASQKVQIRPSECVDMLLRFSPFEKLMAVVWNASEAELTLSWRQNCFQGGEGGALISVAPTFSHPELCCSIAKLSMKLIVALVNHTPSSLREVLEHPQLRDWIICTIICCPSLEIRETISEGMYELFLPAQQANMLGVFYEKLFQYLVVDLASVYGCPPLSPDGSSVSSPTSSLDGGRMSLEKQESFRKLVQTLKPESYLSLLDRLVGLSHPSPKVLLEYLVGLLWAQPVVECRLNPQADELVIGLLNLVASLLKGCNLYEKWAIGVFKKEYGALKGVVERLTNEKVSLDQVPFEGGFLYHLLHHFLFDTAVVGEHGLFSAPVCRTKEARHAGLQVVTELITGCQPNFLRLSEFVIRQNGPECETQRRGWHYLPENFDRVCDFSGLENLGATCYMNSLVQNFFMTPYLRYHLFNLAENAEKKEKEKQLMVEVKEEGEGEKKEGEEGNTVVDQSLLYQLQLVFLRLQETEKKAIDTRSFFEAFQKVDPAASPTVQMDADEFLNVFFDRLERQLKPTPHAQLLSHYYGGVLSHVIESRECVHSTHREENFFALSLEVKGKKNIGESLDLFIAEDTLDGDNKYRCEKCDAKVAATKRCSVKKLPNTLIVHLKRFDFDVETFVRMKINDPCSFPMELDMFPFTEEGIQASRKESSDSSSSSSSSSGAPQKGGPEHQYRLVGVVVHTGTAESGHYYSFIKDRFPSIRRTTPPTTPLFPTSSQRGEGGEELQGGWFQFNDSNIDPFDTANMDAQCFGGFDFYTHTDPDTQQPVPRCYPRTHSAYMLFYERAKQDLPEVTPKVPETSREMEEMLPDQMYRKVWSENSSFLRDKGVFTERYARFVWDLGKLFSGVEGERTGEGVEYRLRAMEMICMFLFETYCYSKDKMMLQSLVGQAKGLCEGEDGGAVWEWFLRSVVEREWAKRMLLQCVCGDSRREFASLLLHALNLARVSEREGARKMVEGEGEQLLSFFVIGKLVEMLGEVKKHWRQFEQYFRIFYAFCEFGREERDWLRTSGLICVRFADFYLETLSPFQISDEGDVNLPNQDQSSTETNQQPISNFNNLPAHRQTGFKRGMGDRSHSPPVKYLLKTVSCLLRECEWQRDTTSSPRNNEPSSSPDGSISPTSSSPYSYGLNVGQEPALLDPKNRAVCECMNFFYLALSDDIEDSGVWELVLHLSWQDRPFSLLFEPLLLSGAITADKSKFQVESRPYLGLSTRFLGLCDSLQHLRITSFLGAFLEGIWCLSPSHFPSICGLIHYLVDLVGENRVCRDWVVAQINRWCFEWLVQAGDAGVRRSAADLLVVLAGLEKKQVELAQHLEGSPMAVDSPVVEGKEGEVGEVRRVVFDHLVSFLGEGARLEGFLDPRRFGSLVTDTLYSLDCYHLVDYFRLLRLLVEEGMPSPLPFVDALTGYVIRIDEPRIDCDENKAELITLLYSLVKKNEAIAKHVASQTSVCQRFLAIHISTISSYVVYNTRCLSLFYEILASLLPHNDDLKNSFKTHPNIRFAMEQFFISRDYPGIATALLKLCIQLVSFPEFREMAFSVLLRGLQPSSPASIPLLMSCLHNNHDVEMFCLGGGLGVAGGLLQEYCDLGSEGAMGCAGLLKEVCFRIQGSLASSKIFQESIEEWDSLDVLLSCRNAIKTVPVDKQSTYQGLMRLLLTLSENYTGTGLLFWNQEHEAFEPLLAAFLSQNSIDKSSEEFLSAVHSDVLWGRLPPEILANYYDFACDICALFLRKYGQSEMASEAVVLAILVINEALAFLPGAPPPSLGGLLAVFCEALGENGGAGAEGLMGESRAILTTCRIVRNPIYMRLPRAVDFVAVCLPFVGGGGGEGEGGGGELGYSDLLEGLVGLVFDKVKPREGDREGGLEENVLYARVLGVLCGDLGVRSLFLGLVEEKDVFEIVASATAQVSPEKSQANESLLSFLHELLQYFSA